MIEEIVYNTARIEIDGISVRRIGKDCYLTDRAITQNEYNRIQTAFVLQDVMLQIDRKV